MLRLHNTKLELALLLAVALPVSFSEAQTNIASALVKEGEPLPGDQSGRLVTSIENTATSGNGGFAFSVTTDESFCNIWGRRNQDECLSVLHSEATFGNLTVDSFGDYFGMSESGDIFYGISSTDSISGDSNLLGVVLNNKLILNELDPIPATDLFSTFNNTAKISAVGQPYWIGGVSDVPGGSSNFALFFGENAQILLRGGDTLKGLPDSLLLGSGVDRSVRFSAAGSNYITRVTMQSSMNRRAIVVNGEGLVLDGTLVRSGNPIPKSVGGYGGNYHSFRFLGITEYGNKFMIVGSDDIPFTNNFVMIDGQIVLHEGDLIDDFLLLIESVDGAVLTEDGNWACIWNTFVTNQGIEREVLIINGEIVLTEGDPVDWNGDGVIDAGDEGAEITSFTGIQNTGISVISASRARPDGSFRLCFTARIDVRGNIREAGFELETQGITIVPGDVNCDGVANLLDVVPFVQQLSSQLYSPAADLNADGILDLLDVSPFVESLAHN